MHLVQLTGWSNNRVNELATTIQAKAEFIVATALWQISGVNPVRWEIGSGFMPYAGQSALPNFRVFSTDLKQKQATDGLMKWQVTEGEPNDICCLVYVPNVRANVGVIVNMDRFHATQIVDGFVTVKPDIRWSKSFPPVDYPFDTGEDID